MDRRAMIEDHLVQAERHVAQAQDHVARQAELAARLERDGHDTKEAKRLLGQFEDMLAMHVLDRDRLRAELADL